MANDPRGRWFRTLPASHRHHDRRGPESSIQAEVAAWFAADPDTVLVERERPLIAIARPDRLALAFPTSGNLRPDVLVWSAHFGPERRYLTVVECKALTACERDVEQLWQYVTYLSAVPALGFEVEGVLAAPRLCQEAQSLPARLRFAQIPDAWWAPHGS